jgi:poly-gamma-glutamate capsule biosynthesis protein CapA/YwtB (metallophosphatase superfamily)
MASPVREWDAEMSKRGDRITLLAFASFWLVIAFGGWLGYNLVQASGFAGSTRHSSSASRSPQRVAAPAVPPPLTIASVFAAQPPSLAQYGRQNLRTLIATGDAIPARSVNYKMVTYNDFLYPFRRTAGYLRSGDMTLINLESPLIANGCPVVYEGMQFCGDPRFVQGLKYAGVDTACTANNHIGNYGPQGIQETWNHLGAAGIGYCGYGKVDHKTVRGLRFAFLAYNTVGQRFHYVAARRQIRAARKGADVVIVSVHWGKEYVAVPTVAPGIADDDPQRVAHWIIDSGADLIIGNHPHHVQAVEIYHHHFICYAHGNFVFDQMFSMPTREGVVGTYTFYGKRLVAVRYRPVVIYDYAQPRWADPVTARQILNGMRDATWQLAHRKSS